MLDKQKKQKSATNNISININLKVESKSNNLIGKKISNSKEINHNNKDLGRSNVTTETLNKKKLSMRDNYCKSKRSVEEFINEHTISYENNQSDQQCQEKQTIQKPNMARNDFFKQSAQRDRKRMKSKSLQNLKIKYYQRSLQKSRQSVSKSKEKSVKKKKHDSPKSFIRSGKQPKSNSKQNSQSKSKSKSKSRSKSKSKSKSPLQFSKKKSLQIFKIQETATSRQKQREKSKEKRSQRSRQKYGLTAKKFSHDIHRQRQKTAPININKKYSAQIKKQLNKKISSKQKTKIKKGEGDKKQLVKIPKQQTKQSKKVPPKKMLSGNKYIYHDSYLNNMVTNIQSVCRGYLARKKFENQLNQESNRLSDFKNRLNKLSVNWDLQSSNSVICIESQSYNSVRSLINKGLQNKSNQVQNVAKDQGASFNPSILLQLQKLRKKIEQQEGRFKMLEQQNSELKANLSKISKQPNKDTNIIKIQSVQLQQQFKLSGLRLASEQNQPENLTKQHKKNNISDLPIAIKTEESNNEQQYVDLKKKVEMYECSPKNSDFRFNKKVIKKLFLKEQQRINEKYFRKNRQYEHMLQQEMGSPKSLSVRREQLQKKIELEKRQALNRFKQAQKALLLIAELQQDNSLLHNYDQYYPKKQNQNSHNNSANNSKNNSPSRKGINLYISVDQIDSDMEKYHPILVNHVHRQNQFQSSKQQEDLSFLYKKAMSDKMEGKRSNQYLKEEQIQHEQHSEKKYNAPSIQIYDSQDQKSNGRLEQSQKHMATKGFQTNLRYIRLFYIKFCQFFRQIPIFKDQILSNLSEQMTFDLQLFLKSYRASMDYQNKKQLIFPYFKQLATYNLAIPVHILNSFYEQQSNTESSLFNKSCLDLKESSKLQYQKHGFSFYQLKQYHDLALIDAFNEALNFERPGGTQASNLDQLTQDFHAVFKDKVKAKFDIELQERLKEQNLDIILANTIGRVINNWAFNLCGFFNDSQDPDQQVSQQKLQQIRHVRLNLMLEKTLVEQEINIINMSSFKFYVRFDLQAKIFDILIEQFLHNFNHISLMRLSNMLY